MLGAILDCWKPLSLASFIGFLVVITTWRRYSWWWHICQLLCIFSVHKLSHIFQRRILHAWSGKLVHMATFGRCQWQHLSVATGLSVVEVHFGAGLKPRMSDANKDLSLFWIFLLLTMSINSNLIQLINIRQDNSWFKLINFSESSDFQQLRRLSTRW